MNTIHDILFYILVGEVGYLFLLSVILLLWKWLDPFFRRRSMEKKKRIARLISDLINRKKPFSFSKEFSSFAALLGVMESFDRRLQDNAWQELKRAIGIQYLLPQARRLAKSSFWRKRNMAARAFSLIADLNDEPALLVLMEDSSFLVRCFAASALIHLESRKGCFKTLQHMVREFGYARCYYTDILLQGSELVLSEILSIAEETKDAQLQLACSEILSKKTIPFPLPFLRRWLQDKDPQMRLRALKILARNPQDNTEEFVSQALRDSDENIRAAAICCLEHSLSPRVINQLEKYLSDAVWSVRLQAATLLKKMEKIAILKKQSKALDVNAYEVAQYVLVFG